MKFKRAHKVVLAVATVAAASAVAITRIPVNTSAIQNYEWDHFCAIEDGGSPNDLANLRLQPDPYYHLKDQVENLVHKKICDGSMTLAEGQAAVCGSRTAWIDTLHTYIDPTAQATTTGEYPILPSGTFDLSVTQANIQQTICQPGYSTQIRKAEYPASQSSKDKAAAFQKSGF